MTATQHFTVVTSDDFASRCMSRDLDRVLAARGHQNYIFVRIRKKFGRLRIDVGTFEIDASEEHWLFIRGNPTACVYLPGFYDDETFDELFKKLAHIYADIPDGEIRDHTPFADELDGIYEWLAGIDADIPDTADLSCHCGREGCES